MATDKAGDIQVRFYCVNVKERGLSGRRDLRWVLSGAQLCSVPARCPVQLTTAECLLGDLGKKDERLAQLQGAHRLAEDLMQVPRTQLPDT